MKNKSLKSFMVILTAGLLVGQTSYGFGKKKSKEPLAHDVEAAIESDPHDHSNTSSFKRCRLFGKKGSSPAEFAKLGANGCFPEGSTNPGLVKTRESYCMDNCATLKCSANDPEHIIKLCKRFCSTVDVGSPRYHKILSQCFSKWGLTADADFIKLLSDWEGADSASFPLTFGQATGFQAYLKRKNNPGKALLKKRKAELDAFKKSAQQAAEAYAAYSNLKAALERQMQQTMAALNNLEKVAYKVQGEKQDLVNSQIDEGTLDDIMNQILQSVLPKGQKDKTFKIGTTKVEIAETMATIAIDLRTLVAALIREKLMGYKQQLSDEKWKGIMRDNRIANRLLLKAKAARAKLEGQVTSAINSSADQENDGDGIASQPSKRRRLIAQRNTSSAIRTQ